MRYTLGINKDSVPLGGPVLILTCIKRMNLLYCWHNKAGRGAEEEYIKTQLGDIGQFIHWDLKLKGLKTELGRPWPMLMSQRMLEIYHREGK